MPYMNSNVPINAMNVMLGGAIAGAAVGSSIGGFAGLVSRRRQDVREGHMPWYRHLGISARGTLWSLYGTGMGIAGGAAAGGGLYGAAKLMGRL